MFEASLHRGVHDLVADHHTDSTDQFGLNRDGDVREGFLWPATYRVLPDTTPDELVRLMLDKFAATVGEAS